MTTRTDQPKQFQLHAYGTKAWDNTVIVEVTGGKDQVIEFLNQMGQRNPEYWRKVYKMRSSKQYRGRAALRIEVRS